MTTLKSAFALLMMVALTLAASAWAEGPAAETASPQAENPASAPAASEPSASHPQEAAGNQVPGFLALAENHLAGATPVCPEPCTDSIIDMTFVGPCVNVAHSCLGYIYRPSGGALCSVSALN